MVLPVRGHGIAIVSSNVGGSRNVLFHLGTQKSLGHAHRCARHGALQSGQVAKPDKTVFPSLIPHLSSRAGRGSGSFTGGLLIGQFGTRDAFRYMGLLAVVGGIAYGLLHLIWLRKFDHTTEESEEEVEAVEAGETEKLTEPATKEQGTSMSLERLSLMIKYNQIGSLSSLPRGSRVSS